MAKETRFVRMAEEANFPSVAAPGYLGDNMHFFLKIKLLVICNRDHQYTGENLNCIYIMQVCVRFIGIQAAKGLQMEMHYSSGCVFTGQYLH